MHFRVHPHEIKTNTLRGIIRVQGVFVCRLLMNTNRCVIIANGDAPSAQTVQRWLRPGDTLVCADGGCHIALQMGLRPAIAIGDFDSLSDIDLQQLHALQVDIRRHPAHKDETDLELALQVAAALQPSDIVVLGALGGRLDHEMANLMLLAMPELHGQSTIIAGEGLEIHAIDARQQPATLHLLGRTGETVSLIPFGGDAHGIVTHGLHYPLRNETLRIGPARGVSNVMIADQAQIDVAAGLLLCLHQSNPT